MRSLLLLLSHSSLHRYPGNYAWLQPITQGLELTVGGPWSPPLARCIYASRIRSCTPRLRWTPDRQHRSPADLPVSPQPINLQTPTVLSKLAPMTWLELIL
ncbi:hypothetical protein P4O66_012244 [Electrophorus voltai]|uniref:Uncharacterized protein n=1 Tax=Electrophorus voltai TaxID=2609070 RepID=A0AAD8Z691_9TELE|nr:hypothetical protein P4O66_012244 [Electrophorus voltai]